MGRSQVARNRTQGRPGNKGRGRGRTSTTTDSSVSRRVVNDDKNLGSNAWRFERKDSDLDTDLKSCAENLSCGKDLSTSTFYEEATQGIDTYRGPSHDSIGFHSMDLDGRSTSTIDNDSQNFSTRINTSLLSIALKNLPMEEWMRMPQRHVGFIDQRDVKKKDGKNATNIQHIKLCGEDACAIDPDHGLGDKSNKIMDIGGSEDPDMDKKDVSPQSKDLSLRDEGHERSEKYDHSVDDEDTEDLDSWLDSVIS
eukprot:CAMPEP_0198258928 /NCGR_PEP_ID=MMETSP1447-20131203/8237_1 /TAXON_ID=420782 /ORGANISM="Chaetoceros dichaeta, Strain CCMP1751" /LENGTH=252 /DNA_ID=CAMNT_0043946181 /DNA_START=29 /DNA_END=787 /DNA_ORIENTATION=-